MTTFEQDKELVMTLLDEFTNAIKKRKVEYSKHSDSRLKSNLEYYEGVLKKTFRNIK